MWQVETFFNNRLLEFINSFVVQFVFIKKNNEKCNSDVNYWICLVGSLNVQIHKNDRHLEKHLLSLNLQCYKKGFLQVVHFIVRNDFLLLVHLLSRRTNGFWQARHAQTDISKQLTKMSRNMLLLSKSRFVSYGHVSRFFKRGWVVENFLWPLPVWCLYSFERWMQG